MRLTSAEPMRRLTPASTAQGTSDVRSRSGSGSESGLQEQGSGSGLWGRSRSVEAGVGARVGVRTGARARLGWLGRGWLVVLSTHALFFVV